MNRKGESSLNGLYAGVIVLASLGILIAILLYVNTEMGDNFKTPTTGTTVNESAFVNNTGYTLAQSTLLDYSRTSITIRNATSGALVSTGNYTIVNNVIRNATSINFNRVNITYTYAYSIPTSSYNASQSLNGYILAFIPWIGIILLVLGASVVLFYVVRSFSGGQKGP